MSKRLRGQQDFWREREIFLSLIMHTLEPRRLNESHLNGCKLYSAEPFANVGMLLMQNQHGLITTVGVLIDKQLS